MYNENSTKYIQEAEKFDRQPYRVMDDVYVRCIEVSYG